MLADRDVYFLRELTDGTFTRELFSCPKDGCNGAPTRIVRDSNLRLEDWAMATDARHIYWSSVFDIYRCPLAGCGETPEAVVSNEFASGPLLVQGKDLFYSFVADALPGYSAPQLSHEAEIHSAPIDGSRPPVRIATGVGVTNWTDIAVDENNVYWLDGAAHVLSCPRTGCVDEPTALVTTDDAKRELKVHSAGLYWLQAKGIYGNWSTSRGAALESAPVYYCPRTGCPPDGPRAITGSADAYALSSDYVYWTNGELGDESSESHEIYRAPKPRPAE